MSDGQNGEMDKLVSLQILQHSLQAQMALMLSFASAHDLSEHPLLKRLFEDMSAANYGLIADINQRADAAYQRERDNG